MAVAGVADSNPPKQLPPMS